MDKLSACSLNKKRVVLWSVLSALLVLFVGGVLLWITPSRLPQCVPTSSLPQDGELRQLYDRHEQVFCALRNMIMEERILRGIGEDFLCALRDENDYRIRCYWREGAQWSGDDRSYARSPVATDRVLSCVGTTTNRYDKYLSLLRTVSAKRVTYEQEWTPHPFIRVSVYASGIVPSSVYKGIVYFPKGIPAHYTIVECTDNVVVGAGVPGDSEWFVPLGNGWYIWHMRS